MTPQADLTVLDGVRAVKAVTACAERERQAIGRLDKRLVNAALALTVEHTIEGEAPPPDARANTGVCVDGHLIMSSAEALPEGRYRFTLLVEDLDKKKG